MEEKLYLFRISLLGTVPEIWRRFTVPTDIPLDRFHDVIQIFMGWTDSHLHEFTISKKHYTEYPESKRMVFHAGNTDWATWLKEKGQSLNICTISATFGNMNLFLKTAVLATGTCQSLSIVWREKGHVHRKMLEE
jgi:hypothetical protein